MYGLGFSGLLAANCFKAQNLEKLGLNADEAEMMFPRFPAELKDKVRR